MFLSYLYYHSSNSCFIQLYCSLCRLPSPFSQQNCLFVSSPFLSPLQHPHLNSLFSCHYSGSSCNMFILPPFVLFPVLLSFHCLYSCFSLSYSYLLWKWFFSYLPSHLFSIFTSQFPLSTSVSVVLHLFPHSFYFCFSHPVSNNHDFYFPLPTLLAIVLFFSDFVSFLLVILLIFLTIINLMLDTI